MKKKISAIMLTFFMLIAITAMSAPVSAASASSNVTNGWYRIKHVGSGKYLDILNVDVNNGAKLQIFQSNWNRKNQTFYFQRLTDGTYRIKAMHSGKYLEVVNSRTDNNAPVQQFDWTDTHATKRWYVYNKGSGNYEFVNKNSGKAMNVYGNNTANNTTVGQYTRNNTTAQQFKLERVNTFSDLKTKFPNNKYWNHPSGNNNPNGYSSTPCTHHGSCGYYPNNCKCNSFNNAIQCLGFVHKLINEIYGQNFTNWSNKVVSNPTQARNYLVNNAFKSGDVVRWNNNKHTILITGYNSSTQTYTYVDCNSNGTCIIKWGNTITKNTLLGKNLSSYYIAPHCAV